MGLKENKLIVNFALWGGIKMSQSENELGKKLEQKRKLGGNCTLEGKTKKR